MVDRGTLQRVCERKVRSIGLRDDTKSMEKSLTVRVTYDVTESLSVTCMSIKFI